MRTDTALIPSGTERRTRTVSRRPAGILPVCLAVLLTASCVAPSPKTPSPPPKAPTAAPSATVRQLTPSPGTTSSPAPATTATPARPRPERVLILSLDGLRPDALSVDRTPTILALAEAGASTMTAQTVHPSVTLPAHASMLSGYDVEQHGITWNDYQPQNGTIRTSTLFSLSHEAGLHTEMVVSKEKLVQLVSPGSVDEFTYVPGGDYAVAEEAGRAIADGFDVLFVHFPGPDTAGHEAGWMSPIYLGTVAHTDEAVARTLAALETAGLRQDTLIILTSDHGGHDTLHGSSLPEDMTVPWIIAGPGVIPGTQLASPVVVYDTAATVEWSLGLVQPTDLAGKPVLEAFGEESVGTRVRPPGLSSAPKVPFPALRRGGRVEKLDWEGDPSAVVPVVA